MDATPEMRRSTDLRDHLAAERTLLAWIRMGLALMGFGFVVARFGLFLQQVQVAQRGSTTQHYGLSLWFGTALIGAGIALNLFSGWHHAQLLRRLNRGQDVPLHSTALALSTCLFLSLVGLAMAIYLISFRNSAH